MKKYIIILLMLSLTIPVKAAGLHLDIGLVLQDKNFEVYSNDKYVSVDIPMAMMLEFNYEIKNASIFIKHEQDISFKKDGFTVIGIKARVF